MARSGREKPPERRRRPHLTLTVPVPSPSSSSSWRVPGQRFLIFHFFLDIHISQWHDRDRDQPIPTRSRCKSSPSPNSTSRVVLVRRSRKTTTIKESNERMIKTERATQVSYAELRLGIVSPDTFSILLLFSELSWKCFFLCNFGIFSGIIQPNLFRWYLSW